MAKCISNSKTRQSGTLITGLIELPVDADIVKISSDDYEALIIPKGA